MNRSVEVIVSLTGEIKIDAVGFKGADCEQATKFLEAALGLVSERVKKPEYHQSRTAKRQQQVGT